MKDLCSVSADLRHHEDEQAKPGLRKPSEREFSEQMEKHFVVLSDIKNDETINALIDNPSAFRSWYQTIEGTLKTEMVHQLSEKERDLICIYSRILVNFMRDTMEVSMKKVVEEELS